MMAELYNSISNSCQYNIPITIIAFYFIIQFSGQGVFVTKSQIVKRGSVSGTFENKTSFVIRPLGPSL